MYMYDRLYGSFEIQSSAILELLKSETLQRLKKINQYGIPDEYYFMKNYSRYEHSVGVMLLLKLLGASEKEQIAGLLHDVSHTAFSHVIDWLHGHGKEEGHQDLNHKEYLIKSEAAEILIKYGYNPSDLADYHRYGLLEQEIPNLCADRIDYFFREFSMNFVKQFIPHMKSFNKEIVFNDEKIGLRFAETFLNQQMTHWSSYESATRYYLFTRILRHALDKKYIVMNDFWKDDMFVLGKINIHKDAYIENILNVMRHNPLLSYPKGNERMYKKFRYVDPHVLIGEKLTRVSSLYPKFQKKIDIAKKIMDEGILMPLI